MLKVIQDCSCFALLRLVIAPENSRLSLNQSDAKHFFPRALFSQVDFTLSSLWRLKVFSLPLIDRFDKFGFGFTTLNRRESALSAPDGYFKAWQIWTCWYSPWLCPRRIVMGTAEETCIVWTEVLLTMVNNTSGNRYALFWSPFFFASLQQNWKNRRKFKGDTYIWMADGRWDVCDQTLTCEPERKMSDNLNFCVFATNSKIWFILGLLIRTLNLHSSENLIT